MGLTPIRNTPPAEREEQARRLVDMAMRSTASAAYAPRSRELAQLYGFWLQVSALPAERQLPQLQEKLAVASDPFAILALQTMCRFIQSDNRPQNCAVFMDKLMSAMISDMDINNFPTAPFKQVMLAVIHPYHFQDRKMEEVL